MKAKLQRYNQTLDISDNFATYSDYWSSYHSGTRLVNAAGSTATLTSRLINRQAASNLTSARGAVEIIAGVPDGYVVSVVDIVSGGQVFANAAGETSGLSPAQRVSNFFVTVGMGVSPKTADAVRRAVMNDARYVKGAALKKLAPNIEGYMNQGGILLVPARNTVEDYICH